MLPVLSRNFDKELTAIASGLSEPNSLIRRACNVETFVKFELQPKVLAVVVNNSEQASVVLDRDHFDHVSALLEDVFLVVLDAHECVENGGLTAKTEVTSVLIEVDDLENVSASILLLIAEQSRFLN